VGPPNKTKNMIEEKNIFRALKVSSKISDTIAVMRPTKSSSYGKNRKLKSSLLKEMHP